MLGQNGAMRALGLGMLGPAGVGQADKDAAAIVRTQRAGDETVAFQSADHPRQGALRQMHRVGQLLHPMAVILRPGEPIEHLEVAHSEPVWMQLPLQRTEHPRVSSGELSPLGNPALLGRGCCHGRQGITFPRIKCTYI